MRKHHLCCFKDAEKLNSIDPKFYLARGRTPCCPNIDALEIIKWSFANDHYLILELNSAQKLKTAFSAKNRKAPLISNDSNSIVASIDIYTGKNDSSP